MTDQTNKTGFTRRGMLGTTAAVTAAGASGIVGMGLGRSQAQSASSPPRQNRKSRPASSTNITSFPRAASPARCASSACRRCAS